MDELIQKVAEKTGLPADGARKAADAVVGFLKEKLPAGLGGQIDQLLAGGGSGGLGDLAKKVGGLLGK